MKRIVRTFMVVLLLGWVAIGGSIALDQPAFPPMVPGGGEAQPLPTDSTPAALEAVRAGAARRLRDRGAALRLASYAETCEAVGL